MYIFIIIHLTHTDAAANTWDRESRSMPGRNATPGTNVGSEGEPVVGSKSPAGLGGSEGGFSVLLSPDGQSVEP